jgi:hypothetical protein
MRPRPVDENPGAKPAAKSAVWLALPLALSLLALPLAAQDDLRTLFPLQAPIYVSDPNLSRLELPIEVLAACSADLSDLRILDTQGREVPYLLDGGRESGRAVEVVQRYDLEIVDVDRARSDRQQGPSIYRESYVLAVPTEVTSADIWDLIVETSRPEYVRRVRVAMAADGSETPLIGDDSLFRLARPLRERNRLTLPRFEAGRLAVTIEGEDGLYLEPVFSLETSSSVAGREKVSTILPIASRREEGRRTVMELERPRGVKADALVLRSSTLAFSRRIEVWDEGPGASNGIVGSKDLYRVQAAASVEDVEVPLSGVSGNLLRVVIENGDSPPLEELAFVATGQRPSLSFTLAPQGDGVPAGTLLFGGGRAYLPQYDIARLQGLLRPPREGQQARVAAQLYLPPLARLGEITENPGFGAAPTLSFAMRPGGAIDPRLYTHRRTLRLDPSAEGLSRLTLTIEDLARAQPDLRDVRIVDAESRQWAYLAEPRTASAAEVLGVEGPTAENGASEYELTLPVRPVTLDQITLETATAFFDREFELIASRDETEFSLFRGRLRRRAGDGRPVVIALDARRIDSLKLRIYDGNDAPLELSRVEARFPLAQVYVAAPAGEYALLLGNAEDQPPSYELSRVSAAVLAVRSNDAKAEPLEPNPAFSAGARLVTGSGPQQVLLWAALILVVGVLSVVTLKMVRQQPAAKTPASSETPAASPTAQEAPGPPASGGRRPDGGESS